MATATDRLEIDAIDFEVPCRRFTISATITRDRQLPVVEEFLLRLLAVLDRVSIRRLRAWFGFTQDEIETVLIDLQSKGQIETEADDVFLALGGRDLFRATPEGAVPQLVEVAQLIDHVWFDLVSRNMVQRSRARPVEYLVRLREQPNARDLPATFARQAFESNFRDYARRIARLDDPDAVNIYAVSDVEAGIYSYQSVRAVIELDPNRSAVRPRFAVFEDEPSRFQSLIMKAVEEWRTLSAPEASHASALEYERLTGDPLPDFLLEGEPTADKLHEHFIAPAVSDFRRTLGATYVERNAEILGDIVTDLCGTRAKPAEIVWLRPNGTQWGRSRRVLETLQGIRDILRNSKAPEVKTRLVMSRSTHNTVRKNHRRLFDRGELLPQGYLPSNIEILLVDDVAALVNLHLNIGGQSVAVGGIVTDAKRLARMIDRLNFCAANWEVIWEPRLQGTTKETSP